MFNEGSWFAENKGKGISFLIRNKEYIIVVPGWVVKMLLSNSTELKLSIRPIGISVKSKGAPVTN